VARDQGMDKPPHGAAFREEQTLNRQQVYALKGCFEIGRLLLGGRTQGRTCHFGSAAHSRGVSRFERTSFLRRLRSCSIRQWCMEVSERDLAMLFRPDQRSLTRCFSHAGVCFLGVGYPPPTRPQVSPRTAETRQR
jgi:hypothetical protein